MYGPHLDDGLFACWGVGLHLWGVGHDHFP